MSDSPIRGSCLCGAVAFTVTPPFSAFQYCHCSRCRKATGSAHAANLFVGPDQVAWVSGHEHVRTYELPEARFFNTSFCGRCGSALPWKTRTGHAWIVPAGALDDDPGETPRRAIHWASRAPWYTPTPDLDVHDEFPPRKG